MKISTLEGFHSDEYCLRGADSFVRRNTAPDGPRTRAMIPNVTQFSLSLNSTKRVSARRERRLESDLRLRQRQLTAERDPDTKRDTTPDVHATPAKRWGKHTVHLSNFYSRTTEGNSFRLRLKKKTQKKTKHDFPLLRLLASPFKKTRTEPKASSCSSLSVLFTSDTRWTPRARAAGVLRLALSR